MFVLVNLSLPGEPDLGAANVSVDTLAGIALLFPPAAVRKLQASVTTRLPKSDDWREQNQTVQLIFHHFVSVCSHNLNTKNTQINALKIQITKNTNTVVF